MLPRWDLTPFFPSLDDPSVAGAVHEVARATTHLAALYDEHEVRGGPQREVDAAAGLAWPLRKAEASSRHQLSEAEEALAAQLWLSGGSAWVKLHGDVCRAGSRPRWRCRPAPSGCRSPWCATLARRRRRPAPPRRARHQPHQPCTRTCGP